MGSDAASRLGILRRASQRISVVAPPPRQATFVKLFHEDVAFVIQLGSLLGTDGRKLGRVGIGEYPTTFHLQWLRPL